MLKKIGLGILIVIVLLQFIPTKKNQASIVSANSIEQKYNTPENNSYENKKARKKMEKVISSQEKGWMPLSSYTLIHKDATLTSTEKTIIIDWAKSVQQLLIKE